MLEAAAAAAIAAAADATDEAEDAAEDEDDGPVLIPSELAIAALVAVWSINVLPFVPCALDADVELTLAPVNPLYLKCVSKCLLT